MFTSGDIPPVAVSVTAMPGTCITPRAFFNRIGSANVIWLYTQAQTNPTLEYYKDKVWSGSCVDLSDPATAAELNYLLTLAGTPFTAAIVSAILIDPVMQDELPD